MPVQLLWLIRLQADILYIVMAGDSVGTDDIVLQIETDKVTVDVRYTTGKPGKLKEILVKEEDTVSVGQQVATVTEGEEGSKPEEVSP